MKFKEEKNPNVLKILNIGLQLSSRLSSSYSSFNQRLKTGLLISIRVYKQLHRTMQGTVL